MEPYSAFPTSFQPRPYDEHGIDAVNPAWRCERITDNEEVTTFIVAVADGNLKSVNTKLRHCQNPCSRAVDGDPVEVDRVEPRTRVRMEALVNAVAFSGQSVVQLAVAGRHTAVLDALLSHGGNPNHLANDGQSALTLASRRGCETMVTLLLKAGANVNTSSDRETPALQAAIENDHVGVANMLLAASANPNQQFVGLYCTDTPLTSACRKLNMPLVRLLLEAGALAHLPAGNKVTPLMVASMMGGLELVKLLLKQGGNVNARDATGETALHYAVRGDHVEVARYLMSVRADINVVSSQGSPLHAAVSRGFPELSAMLLNAGADPDAAAPDATTPLILAARQGQLWVVSRLIEAGADVDRVHQGTTALLTAYEYKKDKILFRLLDAGANPNVSGGPRSLLQWVLDSHSPGRRDVLDALLVAGLDVHATIDGRGVLEHAFYRFGVHRDTNLLKQLMQAGADATALRALKGMWWPADVPANRDVERATVRLLAGGDSTYY